MIRVLLMAILALWPLHAWADDLTVSGAWVPVASPVAKVHAAYLVLHNVGTAPVSLTGVAAPGYSMAHLHESREAEGVASMTPIDALEIPAGGTIEMQPGGLHIMLMMPAGPVAEGDKVPMTLTFSDGTELSLDAVVATRDSRE